MPRIEQVVKMKNGKKLILYAGGVVDFPYKHRVGHHRSDNRDPSNPVFSYVQHDSGRHYHWVVRDLISMVKRHPERYPLRTFQTSPHSYQHVLTNNGIEPEHFARMAANPARISEPGIMVVWHWEGEESGNNWATVVDGNHRLVLRYQQGLRDMSYHCFTEEQARFAELALDDDIGMAMVDPAKPISVDPTYYARMPSKLGR